MNVKVLMSYSNNIEEIKISSKLWAILHREEGDYYWVHKDYKSFLERNKIRSTIFNLNCLRELKGVILTDMEIEKRKEFQKENRRVEDEK